jgi:hypothetical protein
VAPPNADRKQAIDAGFRGAYPLTHAVDFVSGLFTTRY